jgi:hypothetical protein
MMDMLSEESRKEYPKTVKELLRLKENIFAQGVCYFVNKIPKLM